MILRRHVPAPPLSGFVDFFWFFEGWDGSHPMEHVLPDGAFELVINLRDGPRKLFDRHDLSRCTFFHGAGSPARTPSSSSSTRCPALR